MIYRSFSHLDLTSKAVGKIDLEQMSHPAARRAVDHLDRRQKESIAHQRHPLWMIRAKLQLHFAGLTPFAGPGDLAAAMGHRWAIRRLRPAPDR